MGTSGESSSSVIVPQDDTFEDFVEKWSAQLRNYHVDLVSASDPDASAADHAGLVKRVMDHYEEYFQVKSSWAKRDVFLMFSSTWSTPLESACSWITDWRPILAIHLVYTLAGFQLGDLTNDQVVPTVTVELSPSQVARMDELHKRTVEEEKEVSDKMGEQQNNVELCELMSLESDERVDSVSRKKEEGLERVLRQADELRVRTLKGIVEIITPSQGVRFLVGVVEFQLGLHDWGRRLEEAN